MRQFLAALARDTSANILAIGGFGAMAMVGGGGLAVDAVSWYLWKRQLQQAVDSGALAGSYALSEGRDVTAAAGDDIDKNDNTNIIVQAVNAPPASGAWSGSSTAVEVIATTQRSLPFSSVFLATPPTITSRAVAAFVSEGEHCIISLADSGIGVNVSGTGDVLLGCGVGANSQSANAIKLEGSSWLAASPLSAVGGIEYGSNNLPGTTDLNPYGLALEDPLASRNLTPPASPAACTANAFEVSPNQTVTLSPGRYCNGFALKGTVTLSPGVYIVDQGEFYISSQAAVTGEGVTIILTGTNANNVATANFAGGADISMRAPTAAEDAVWENILIYQDHRGSSTRSELAGGSDFDMEGIVYMPGSTIRFAGNSGQHSECLLMVAHRVLLTGTVSLDNQCPSGFDDLDLSGRRMRIVE